MLPKLPYWPKIATTLLLCLCITAQAQEDSTNYALRKKVLIGGNAIAYTSLMTGLYSLWYKDYPLEGFHFFNDNKEWLQMDKVGHSFSCYYEGVAGIEMMKWAGYSKKQYSLIGGSYGFLIQTSVEVLDGFSAGWGASMGDLAANTIGSGLAIYQSLAWDEQRVWMKYAYSHSPYARIRPNALGSSVPERMLKDYNGQTYWLSANISSFLKEYTKWPKWLNIAAGYGTDGMVGGHDNTYESEGIQYDRTDILRSRQFYLSPDIDLTCFKTKRKGIRTLLIMANCIKIPMPTLEYQTNDGLKGHWLHF
ncbi:YfiM family protein [Bacteroidia bacterium]|nr:YfiM family protein [Bacteroidia bacterium]MDC1395620.1 YfiM family protein [Bacteroidia bacterium]